MKLTIDTSPRQHIFVEHDYTRNDVVLILLCQTCGRRLAFHDHTTIYEIVQEAKHTCGRAA